MEYLSVLDANPKSRAYSVALNSFSKLVTPIQNKYLRVYRWYNFKHSFSRDLVFSLVSSLGLGSNDLILDPFCGAGTTMLAAKELGIPSVGLDLMPLSVLVSSVKVREYDIVEVRNHFRRVECQARAINPPNDRKIYRELGTYFPRGELRAILKLREAINQIDDLNLRELFLLGLLSILEDSSFTRKDGAFIRTVKGKITSNVASGFPDKMNLIINDLPYLNKLPRVQAKAYLSDARSTGLPSGSISAVLTSPPYPNRHDYTRIYYLELRLGFYNKYESIKKLRYGLLRSHVEARKKYDDEDYEYPRSLQRILAELQTRNLPNRNVINLVDGYFKDMHIWLKEMYRVLIPDGTVSIVIGDARYGGISVPSEVLIREIAEGIGFEHLNTIRARDKGNSPQQMGKYGKVYSPESIISLRKN